MTPKLLTEGYRPTPTSRRGRPLAQDGYQPSKSGVAPPPPPPPNTGSSVVKPKE